MSKIALALIGLAAAAAAQPALTERPAVLPLSLKRAVEIANAPEGNARVRLADESIRQAEARRSEARSALLPNFDAAVSDSSNTRNLKAFGFDLPQIPGFRLPSLAGPFEVFDVRVSGAQSIFDFAGIRRLQAARAGVLAVKAEAQGTREQVAGQVARAYLVTLRAEAALNTAQANTELSDALVRLANSQKTAGTGTGIEVTRAQVQLANDRQRLTVARNEREKAHLQLMRLLGLKLDGDVQLTDQMQYRNVDDVAPAQALRTAIEKRAELKAQQERESSSRLDYSAAKWERLPSIAFFGDYGAIGTPDSTLPTRTAGLSLKVPLFDGGRRDARRAESASQLRAEQIRTRDLKEQIELDVRMALDSLRSAEAQVEVSNEGLSLAGRELEQARRRYEAGVASGIEVTDAQTRLQRARDNQIAALFAHNLARIDLHAAMGAIQELIDTF